MTGSALDDHPPVFPPASLSISQTFHHPDVPKPASRASAALDHRAGTAAIATAPLDRLGMEGAGATPDTTLTLGAGGEVIPVARADFHGPRLNGQATRLSWQQKHPGPNPLRLMGMG